MVRDQSPGQFVAWRMVLWAGVTMIVIGVALLFGGVFIPGVLVLVAGLVVFTVWIRKVVMESRP